MDMYGKDIGDMEHLFFGTYLGKYVHMWKDGTCMDQHLGFSCELYVSYGSKPSGTRMVPQVIASDSPKHSMAMQQEPIDWRYLTHIYGLFTADFQGISPQFIGS